MTLIIGFFSSSPFFFFEEILLQVLLQNNVLNFKYRKTVIEKFYLLYCQRDTNQAKCYINL